MKEVSFHQARGRLNTTPSRSYPACVMRPRAGAHRARPRAGPQGRQQQEVETRDHSFDAFSGTVGRRLPTTGYQDRRLSACDVVGVERAAPTPVDAEASGSTSYVRDRRRGYEKMPPRKSGQVTRRHLRRPRPSPGAVLSLGRDVGVEDNSRCWERPVNWPVPRSRVVG